MQEKKFRSLKPRRSLRTILMIWFLVLSLVPMMFVTGYSLVKYEQAIDKELVERLRANVREFVGTMTDYEKYLANRRTRHQGDPTLAYYLLTNSISQARAQLRGSIRNSFLSSASLFNRDGEMVTTLTPEDSGSEKESQQSSVIVLTEAYKEALEKTGRMTVVDVGPANSMDLIAYTRLDDKSGRRAGFIEEIINIGPAFLANIKKRFGSEVVIFDGKGNIFGGSHPDFLVYPKDSFAKVVNPSQETLFDLTIRNEPYRFITVPVKWGDGQFLVGLGASKQKARTFVRNVNYFFLTMIAAIGVLVIFTSVIATRVIVRPVYDLVEAIQAMDLKEGPTEIPVSSDTEIGVLTESFNEMSRRVYQAQSELETKIKELESAYTELKDTQTRLVHTAKMASLGQLVAGIAHELNNPIGFIYSNMGHLRDYSNRMIAIIDAAEKNPSKLSQAKAENDFKYMVEDLPRLISSCEEGARRTRDIVVGLRSFSRLEEAKLKKVELKEGLEDTLRLLAGELKNRIEVHTDFKPVPEVYCFASQLNQVFMNILTNAAQAIDGNGEIWIGLTHIKKKGTAGLAQVSIRDSGKGMAADVVDKIFDPFFTTKSIGQGTGLGLSISYGIVKKHGGEIQVKSEPGKGTEFIITVPIAGPDGSEA